MANTLITPNMKNPRPAPPTKKADQHPGNTSKHCMQQASPHRPAHRRHPRSGPANSSVCGTSRSRKPLNTQHRRTLEKANRESLPQTSAQSAGGEENWREPSAGNTLGSTTERWRAAESRRKTAPPSKQTPLPSSRQRWSNPIRLVFFGNVYMNGFLKNVYTCD